MSMIFIGMAVDKQGRNVPMSFDTDEFSNEDYAKYCELSNKIKKLDEFRNNENKRLKGEMIGVYSDELWLQTRMERANLIREYTGGYINYEFVKYEVDYRFCGKEDEI